MTIEGTAVQSQGVPVAQATKRYAALLWFLAFLFLLRILGQAIQRWSPVSYLPPFDSFQGSNLPYWILLSAQLAILAVMLRYAWRTHLGSLLPGRRAGIALAWLGWIYMAGSIGRIVVGLFVPAAPGWFTAWISGVFHLVLAGYALILAYYHLRGSRLGQGGK